MSRPGPRHRVLFFICTFVVFTDWTTGRDRGSKLGADRSQSSLPPRPPTKIYESSWSLTSAFYGCRLMQFGGRRGMQRASNASIPDQPTNQLERTMRERMVRVRGMWLGLLAAGLLTELRAYLSKARGF